MRLTKKERFAICEQAALKLLRANDENTPEAQADLLDWTRASAHHFHEVLFAETVADELEGIDPDRRIDVDALPTPPEVDAFSPPVVHEPVKPRAQELRSRRHLWTGALAAALACVAIAAWFWNETSHTVRTVIGEQRSVKLSDGSVMVLNTNSRAQIRFTNHERKIQLLEGEALFIVERDPIRAFRVLVDGSAITAVGTQFNVDRHTEKTRVSVIEGVVVINGDISSSSAPSSGVRLASGEQAVMVAGQVVKSQKADASRAIAWRNRQLIFTETPILQAAAEFNRYNRIQIRVEGDAVGRERIGGVFDADDVQTLVDFLDGDPRFAVTRAEREIVIRRGF